MAKKAAGGAKTKSAAKGMPSGDFVLDVTNLKFIGAAFDEAIKDLQEIKPNARDTKDVDTTIGTLQALKLATFRVCPQTWYKSFKLK